MESSARAQEFQRLLNIFLYQMKRMQIDNAFTAAKRTLELMRELLVRHRYEDAAALITHVRSVGAQMITAKPQELVVGNMVRRVLHAIREVAAQDGSTLPVSDLHPTEASRPVRAASLLTLLEPSRHANVDAAAAEDGAAAAELSSSTPPDSPTAAGAEVPTKRRKGKGWAGKQKVVEDLNELIGEMDLELVEDSIVGHATEHVHANEVIMTFGLSHTTLKFLKKARERRSFQVVVAEGAPKLQGLTMAQHLIDAGIPTLVIPDSAIFTMMARVHKVVVGAQAVLATGGIIAQSGSRLVALAARHYRVPFVIVAGLYKLSPLFPHDTHVMFGSYSEPGTFTDRRLKSATLGVDSDGIHVERSLSLPCPALDYVEPDSISLLITDSGNFTPSYVYRLLSEYYSRDDYILSEELLDKMTGH